MNNQQKINIEGLTNADYFGGKYNRWIDRRENLFVIVQLTTTMKILKLTIISNAK